MKSLLLSLFVLAIFSGCAGDTKKDAVLNDPHADSPADAKASAEATSKDAVSIEAKLAAAEENTTNVTEVKFEKASRSLPALYLKKIDAAFIAAEKKSPLTKVTLVVWSDAEMPTHGQAALPESDAKLATDRGETLKAYIQQKHAKLTTEIVNMAEKPSKLKKFLKTKDVRIQQSIEIAGHGDPKTSRAMIIIEVKEKK